MGRVCPCGVHSAEVCDVSLERMEQMLCAVWWRQPVEASPHRGTIRRRNVTPDPLATHSLSHCLTFTSSYCSLAHHLLLILCFTVTCSLPLHLSLLLMARLLVLTCLTSTTSLSHWHSGWLGVVAQIRLDRATSINVEQSRPLRAAFRPRAARSV